MVGFALATLLRNDRLMAESPDKEDSSFRPELRQTTFDVKPKKPHFASNASAMISLWMQGGPSHLDLFDPKPVLQKLDGKTFEGDIKYDNAAQASPKILGSPWKFKKHGQCGMELSELLPGLAEIVDDITLIRSMHTGVNNHGQSIRALQNGRIFGGRPTLGSWLTYGRGCETENLPAYVALIDPGQLPVMGVENWSNGFLPSLYQGTVVRPREPRILNLDPPPHGYAWKPDQWLESAIEEHELRPFRAILSKDNPTNHASVLVGEGISAEGPLWAINRGDVFPQTTEAIVSCARPLLEASMEAVFVDPYFHPQYPRWREVLEGLLGCVSPGSSDAFRCRIHVKSNDQTASEFHEDCDQFLLGLSHQGSTSRSTGGIGYIAVIDRTRGTSSRSEAELVSMAASTTSRARQPISASWRTPSGSGAGASSGTRDRPLSRRSTNGHLPRKIRREMPQAYENERSL